MFNESPKVEISPNIEISLKVDVSPKVEMSPKVDISSKVQIKPKVEEPTDYFVKTELQISSSTVSARDIDNIVMETLLKVVAHLDLSFRLFYEGHFQR